MNLYLLTRKCLCLYVLWVLAGSFLMAKVDSLRNALKTASSAHQTYQIFDNLARTFELLDAKDSAFHYAKKALTYANTISLPKEEAGSSNFLGFLYYKHHDYSSALKWYVESIKLYEACDSSEIELAEVYENVGILQSDCSRFTEAFECYQKALTIYSARKRVSFKLAKCHDLIGLNYSQWAEKERRLHQHDSTARDKEKLALEHFEKSLELWTALEMPQKIAQTKHHMVIVYRNAGNFEAARLCGKESLAYYQQTGDSTEVARSCVHLGTVALKEGKYQEAWNWNMRAHHIFTKPEVSEPVFLLVSHVNLGSNAYYLKAYQVALKHLYTADSIAKQLNIQNDWTVELYEYLYKAYKALEDYPRAFQFLEAFTHLRDSLLGQESLRQITNWTNYDFQELARQKEQQQIAAERRAERIFFAGLLIALILSTIGIYYFFRQRIQQKIIRQNKLLLSQQEQLIRHERKLHQQIKVDLLKDVERKLMNAQVDTQEALMRKIGRDIHDQLGGLLAAGLLKIDMLEQALSKKHKDSWKEIRNLVQQVYDETRIISHELEGLSIDQGLIPYLKELCNLFHDTKIDVQLYTHEIASLQLPPRVERNLARMIQEALTNVIKYAEASEVEVQLLYVEDDRMLVTSISDNGKGFDPNQQPNGIGLKSMRARTREMNGTFRLETQPGLGTAIFLEIPLFIK